jgi:anti-sigma regulatory factor (Ser/Thr protein kinase)
MADPPQTVRMLVELRLVPSGAHLIELRDAARRALPGVADEIVQDMLLVLDEAVANAIRYGSAAGQPVAVSIDCDGDWIDLAVVDQGPTPRLPSLPNEPPPPLATGGRGLWLILQLADQVTLEREGAGVRLTMRRRVRVPVGAGVS